MKSLLIAFQSTFKQTDWRGTTGLQKLQLHSDNHKAFEEWDLLVCCTLDLCWTISLVNTGSKLDGEQPKEVLHPNTSQLEYKLFHLYSFNRFWKTTKIRKKGLKNEWVSICVKESRRENAQ